MQDALAALIGARLQRVERTQYIHQGEADPFEGDLQLWFDGRVVRLRAAGDGTHLEVVLSPWDDPFAGPLDAENESYVATHGRFVLVDVSANDDYTELIGARLLGYEPRYMDDGRISGATLRFETATLHAFVELDELDVSWSPPGD
ncbi:MAG: hypothetical protein H7138_05975 [Myxococcales bacterium]|nr:hypothetical protein [Myxococcales bacterium]